MQSIYIAIGIISLAIIAGVMLLKSRQKSLQKRNPSPFAMIGLLLVVLAIVIGENPWVGYSLIGLGVLLASVDLFRNPK